MRTLPDGAQEKDVAELFLEQINGSSLSDRVVDGRNFAALAESRKPDIPHYFPTKPHIAFNLASIGDQKKPRTGSDTFTAEEIGHVIGFGGLYLSCFQFSCFSCFLVYAEDLLAYNQPFRPYAILYLLTDTVVQFFILHRFTGSTPGLLRFCLEQSPVYRLLNDGRGLLWALYQANEEDLHFGLPPVSFPPYSVTLTGLVGMGSSADVYSAEVAGKGLMAVKWFKHEHLDKLEIESKNHRRVEQYDFLCLLFCCLFIDYFP
jgi:hypothetical protein